MTAKLLEAESVIAGLQKKMRAEVNCIHRKTGCVPGLAVLVVGKEPATISYVTDIQRQGKMMGFYVRVHHFPVHGREGELRQLIVDLNNENKIHGIAVQLPLPPPLNTCAIRETLDPNKDVECVHPLNLGKLFSDEQGYIPPVPHAIMRMIEFTCQPFHGKSAALIGRNNMLGKPLSLLMLRQNVSPIICHSYTRELPEICRAADIVIAAAGKPALVKGEWVKPGAVVVDAGATWIKDKLVGDVDFDAAAAVAGWITPVPGGVGPVTVAMLAFNTLEAFKNITHDSTNY